jgi:hypothetical protein
MKIWTYKIKYNKNTKRFYKILYFVRIGDQF